MLIELLKIVLPAIVVALTAYFLIKRMLDGQVKNEQLRQLHLRNATTLPLRLQAYERLALLCERLSLPGLLMRSQQPNANAAMLKVTLLMNIQQEFEHNISQQIYVSDQLWAIIQALRDDSLQFIDLVSEKVDKSGPAADFTQALLAYHQQRGMDPTHTAQAAIRKEVAVLF